jgi:hypothetical protein
MRVIKMPLETGLNTFPTTNSELKLQHINYQHKLLYGWFSETQTDTKDSYQVYVALTGETLNPEFNYVASTQLHEAGGYFMVHAFD